MLRSTLLALFVLPALAPQVLRLPAQGHQLATWFRDITDLAVAPNGNIYTCGYLSSSIDDLPIVPHVLGSPRLDGLDRNCVVACFSPSLVPVLRSMVVFGGADFENALGIDLELDLSGAVAAVHVVGITRSVAFPVSIGAAPTGSDAGYWMRLSADLLVQASALIGPANLIYDIACLGDGEALICGSAVPETPSGILYGPLGGPRDAILLHGRLTDPGAGYVFQELRRATLGGSGDDQFASIARAADGSIFVAGWTKSTDYPTESAFKAPPVESGKGRSVTVPWDYTLQRFTPQFELAFCSPMGGSDNDNGDFELVTFGSRLAFAGGTTSSDFQPAPRGSGAKTTPQGRDAVVVVFDTTPVGAPTVLWSSFFGGSGDERASAAHFDAAGRLHLSGRHIAPEAPKGRKSSSPTPFPLLDNGTGLLVNQDPLAADGGFYSVLSPVSGGYQLNYSSLTGGSGVRVTTTGVALGESVVLAMRPFEDPMPISPTANAPLTAPTSNFDCFLLVTGERGN